MFVSRFSSRHFRPDAEEIWWILSTECYDEYGSDKQAKPGSSWTYDIDVTEQDAMPDLSWYFVLIIIRRTVFAL